MKLSFGDDALEVSSNHVQVTKNDGSLTNQEAVNQLVVDEMLQMRARIEWLEGKHGIIKLPDEYIMPDLHILEANGVANAYLPIPNDTAPSFVAINGEEVDPIQGPYQLMDGDLVYAIFDWDNANFKQLKWVKDIQQFGLNTRTGKRNQIAEGEYAFRYMDSCSPEALKYLDVSNLTDMKQMFFHADVMDVDLGAWDVSNVISFYQMFNYAGVFNQDISSWVTKNVEYRGMNGMFKNATNFNQNLTQWCVPGEWEVPLDFGASSGLATGNYPVWGTCPRYENIAPFTEADMHIFEANATDAFELPIRMDSDDVLYLEINGVQVDLTRRMRRTNVRMRETPLYQEHLDNPQQRVRYVEIMDVGPGDGTPSGDFTEAYEDVYHPGVFDDFDISLDEVESRMDDFVEVKTVPVQLQDGDIVKGIFNYANAYNRDMSWIKDIKQFGSRSDDSYYTTSYDGFPEGYVPPPKLPSGRTPNQVDSVRYMMRKNETASSLTALGTLDISNLTSLYYLCNSWKNMNDPGVLNWDVSHIKNMSYVFSGSSAFNQDIGEHWNPESVTNLAALFGPTYGDFSNPSTDLGKWNPAHITNISELFSDKPNVGNNIAHWDVSKVTNMGSLFEGTSFNQDISHWDVSNCTNLGGMFEDNTAFNQDLSGWDTSSNTSLSFTFYNATSCNFDISGWDTSKVTSLSITFAGKPGFSTANLDLSGWDTSKVQYFNGTFQNNGDQASRIINGTGFNNWDTSSAKGMRSFLGGSWYPSAVPDITGWNTGRVTNMDSMFKYCYDFVQDLTGWCTTSLTTSPPLEFALNNVKWPSSQYPVWGTCPGGEDQITWPYDITDEHVVPEDRMHRFVTDGNNGVPPEIPMEADYWSTNFVTVQKPGEYERLAQFTSDSPYQDPIRLVEAVPAGTIISFYGRWITHSFWNTWGENVPRAADISHIQDILQWGCAFNSYSPHGSTEFPPESIFFPYAFYGTSMTVCTAGLSNVNMDTYPNSFGVGNYDCRYMFAESDFNSPDIVDMDFGPNPNLEGMFMNNTTFNQDLSGWCVPFITEEPLDFATGATSFEDKHKPLWGTCGGNKPTLDLIEVEVARLLTQDGREIEDCHVFVCNGNDVKLPIPPDEEASWIAVNGIECADYSNISAEDGDYIHAIFDWDVAGSSVDYSADWFSDILQIGLCLETGTRNQLKSGFSAFQYMTANPAVLANLDTSNLTDMMHMFSFATNFDQDISGWDVSQVGNMTEMFLNAVAFDQDLSEWCVELIASEPTRFAMNSGFELTTENHPVWGTCGGEPPNPDGGGDENPDGPGEIDQ